MKFTHKTLCIALSALLLSACNNSSSDTETKDSVAPSLTTNLSETGNIVTHHSVFELNGSVSDDLGIDSLTLQLNGENSEIELNDGNFSLKTNLQAGENTLIITATDLNKNTTTLSTTIYFGYTVAAGGSHSGALYNGELYSWGRNNYGQTGLGYTSTLDDNTSTHPSTPTKITLPTTNQIVSLSFNQNFSIALDETGNVWSWGYNKNGELGRSSTDICNDSSSESDCALEASTVSNLSDIVAISAGYSHTLALKNDGSVWAFGTNGDGELGQGDTNTTTQAVSISFEEDLNIVQISAGSDFSCAIDDQGNLYGWGLNSSSQVGYYGYLYKDTQDAWERYIYSPMLILSADTDNPIKEVFANGNSSYILRADNKVYPWGQYGETNEEGKTSYANLDLPEDKLSSISSVKDVAAGSLHLVAVKNDDTVFTWRWSFEGSLGGGESIVDTWMYNYPVIPVFPEQ